MDLMPSEPSGQPIWLPQVLTWSFPPDVDVLGCKPGSVEYALCTFPADIPDHIATARLQRISA